MESCPASLLRCAGSMRSSGYNRGEATLKRPRMSAFKKLVPLHSVPAGDLPDCGLPLPRVFLLSPANMAAIRGQLLLNGSSAFELAQRIRRQGAPIGEVFTFISSLYFRGKLAYAQGFSNPPVGLPGTLIVTSSRGLLPPETIVTLDDLREMSAVPIEPGDARYREPLCRDAGELARLLPAGSKVVLLGSIASRKYVGPLLDVFGAVLLFPREFVGRGDMSRGGLMLRCAEAQRELEYVLVDSAVRRGPRPAKLPSSKGARNC